MPEKRGGVPFRPRVTDDRHADAPASTVRRTLRILSLSTLPEERPSHPDARLAHSRCLDRCGRDAVERPDGRSSARPTEL